MNILEPDLKKILLTLNNSKISGIEMFTILLAKYIDKEKFNLTIAIPTNGQICESLDELGIKYFIFNNKRNGKHTISGMISLFNHISANKYDIIHAQAGIAPCFIGKFIGVKKLIEHRHGLDFTKEELENMSFAKTLYGKLKKHIVNLTLTGSMYDKNKLVNNFKYDSSKVISVYNGLENKSKNISEKSDNKFVIGTIGRLTFQKGQEYFIEMAKILTKENYDFEYHIYGDGEKYDDYKELINKYGLKDRVILKGYTNEVFYTMSSFNIFVLTSRYEGFPYVLLEAMRASTPIISSDVGGINEIIKNGENGILVEKETVSGFVESVKCLFNSNELSVQLADKSRKDFEGKFLIENTVSQIEKIYEMK